MSMVLNWCTCHGTLHFHFVCFGVVRRHFYFSSFCFYYFCEVCVRCMSIEQSELWMCLIILRCLRLVPFKSLVSSTFWMMYRWLVRFVLSTTIRRPKLHSCIYTYRYIHIHPNDVIRSTHILCECHSTLCVIMYFKEWNSLRSSAVTHAIAKTAICPNLHQQSNDFRTVVTSQSLVDICFSILNIDKL